MEMNSSEKNKAMSILKARGIRQAMVEYNGGHDEGYVAVIATRTDGTRYELPRHSTYSGYNQPPVKLTPEQEADNELMELLTNPVYNEWYSFAGEFYVNGYYLWDVEANKVTKSQDVETPSWENFTEEW